MWFLAPILSAIGGAGAAGGALSGIGAAMAGNQLPQMAGKVAGGIFGDAASGAFKGMNNMDMMGMMKQGGGGKDKGGAQAAQQHQQAGMQAAQGVPGYQDMSNPQSLMQMMKMFGGM